MWAWYFFSFDIFSKFLWDELVHHKQLISSVWKLMTNPVCVWAEWAVLGSVKIALKFKYENLNTYTIQWMGQDVSLKNKRNKPWFKPWFKRAIIRIAHDIIVWITLKITGNWIFNMPLKIIVWPNFCRTLSYILQGLPLG